MNFTLSWGEARIIIFVLMYKLHGFAEAVLLVVLLTSQLDGPLGPAALHRVRLAIAELLLLMQHPADKLLLALGFAIGLRRQGPQQREQYQITHV